MWVAFANAKAIHIFFSKNINVYALFNDQRFNDVLTNYIVSFEQLGPGDWCISKLCWPRPEAWEWGVWSGSALCFMAQSTH